MQTLRKLVILLLPALLFFGAPAAAQNTPTPPPYAVYGGAVTVAVTTSSSTPAALPTTTVPFGALTIYNGGTADAYVALGGAAVTASTSSIPVPAGTSISISAVNSTFIAAITATGTTNLVIWQATGPVSMRSNGGSGGGGGGTPGGLNTQLQYNNNGVFGGITGATTDGSVVTLSLPKINAASINGCTLGTNKLCVTGTTALGTALSVNGASIGSNALAVTGAVSVSSFFSGSNVNLNSNTGVFNLRNGGTILSSPATATFQLGAADAAAPVAQTVGVQDVVAGTTDTSGVNWTFNPSVGTGTGLTGNYIFNYAPHGTSGSAQNALIPALMINGDTGAVASTAYIKTGTYTVSTLPAAATAGAGAHAYVTDAVACTFLASLTGGGTTGCPVVSNGTAWQGG